LLLNSPQTLENTGFIAGELSIIVSLDIVPSVFTNSDKGKYKGTRCPVDICSVPTVSQRPVDVGSEPTIVKRRAAAETKKIL
jgi:hypothetical protein